MIDKLKDRTILAANYLLLENSTVRKVANRLGYSKSTIHNDLSIRLKEIDLELYRRVQHLFMINKLEKHIRGGESTKNKYKEA